MKDTNGKLVGVEMSSTAGIVSVVDVVVDIAALVVDVEELVVDIVELVAGLAADGHTHSLHWLVPKGDLGGNSIGASFDWIKNYYKILSNEIQSIGHTFSWCTLAPDSRNDYLPKILLWYWNATLAVDESVAHCGSKAGTSADGIPIDQNVLAPHVLEYCLHLCH